MQQRPNPILRARPALAVLALTVAAACAIDGMPGPREGEAVFTQNCAGCHSYRGEGTGELVGGEQAPDLTGISARNDGTFPRAEMLSTIDGYGRGDHPGVMPEFGKLLEGELVPVEIDGTLTPTPRPLAALLSYLESIQLP